MRTFTIIIPDDAESELEELGLLYSLPLDALVQKVAIDGIHETYETRVLDHKKRVMELK